MYFKYLSILSRSSPILLSGNHIFYVMISMKRILLLSLIGIIFLFFLIKPVKAETEFKMYLNDFYQKQDKASNILKGIEMYLKDGSRKTVCTRQREAAEYGIEATESLIKAFKINGSKTEMESLQAGLNKWKELRDYC